MVVKQDAERDRHDESHRLISPKSLSLVISVSILAALHLVADQRAGAESYPAANRRARTRVADRTTDKAPGRSAAERADARAFFPGGQRTACATRKCQSASQENYRSRAIK